MSKSTDAPKPTPVVEDPHPGSISDGTHPEAAEKKLRRSDESAHDGNAAQKVKGSAKDIRLKSGQTDFNSEAPRHPTKSANAS
jgi:hypothetical protein